jgi:hypothetical protein
MKKVRRFIRSVFSQGIPKGALQGCASGLPFKGEEKKHKPLASVTFSVRKRVLQKADSSPVFPDRFLTREGQESMRKKVSAKGKKISAKSSRLTALQ